jgi:hypothetical protein
MKFRSMAVIGVALGALFVIPSVAAWAQADAQGSSGKEKRSITPPVTAPTAAGRSATESAVLNARQDAARRAKARRAHLAALKKKRHAAKRHHQ